MKIKVVAPTRIDLAGGTLDIFPINVFENGGITVNAAININSEVVAEKRQDDKIVIFSQDLNTRKEFKNIKELTFENELGFLCRIIHFYKPPFGLNIETCNFAPKGSGLGASSSLLIALSFALLKLMNRKVGNKEIIDWGANIEAQAIRVPTGKQDYYAAVYGGINALWFDVDNNVRVEKLVTEEGLIKELENRIILTYTAQSRLSAITNWKMLRRYIDGNKESIYYFHKIKEISLKMRDCLRDGDLKKFPKVLLEEWELRKKLAKGVSNKKIEHIMNSAIQAGAVANKICGAGGGGCMITFAEEEKKDKVINAIKRAGGQILPFKISRRGITTQLSK